MEDVQQVIVELDEVSDVIAPGHTNHVNVRLIGIIDDSRCAIFVYELGIHEISWRCLDSKD